MNDDQSDMSERLGPTKSPEPGSLGCAWAVSVLMAWILTGLVVREFRGDSYEDAPFEGILILVLFLLWMFGGVWRWWRFRKSKQRGVRVLGWLLVWSAFMIALLLASG